MKEGYYKVAKSFMLYRQAHSEDRETLAKLQFRIQVSRGCSFTFSDSKILTKQVESVSNIYIL